MSADQWQLHKKMPHPAQIRSHTTTSAVGSLRHSSTPLCVPSARVPAQKSSEETGAFATIVECTFHPFAPYVQSTTWMPLHARTWGQRMLEGVGEFMAERADGERLLRRERRRPTTFLLHLRESLSASALWSCATYQILACEHASDIAI